TPSPPSAPPSNPRTPRASTPPAPTSPTPSGHSEAEQRNATAPTVHAPTSSSRPPAGAPSRAPCRGSSVEEAGSGGTGCGGPSAEAVDEEDGACGAGSAIARDGAVLVGVGPRAEGFGAVETEEDDALVAPRTLEHLGRLVGGEDRAAMPGQDGGEAGDVRIV